ncbi:hypothetical protein LNQ82_07860 [Conchiformibius steedae DSM 2580]|uniref:Uncharacterized protein n=2 Tax=Conchiformibius steedae TaxID=153493 RepID=A0A3P2A2Z7_9NEIS|nr:hypothetical protein [Conchiformibius steedae]QMT34325.1 hypothetical protein H3L98_04950 [Conchiformibius steedae]RRD89821.1 hypothetical protein EII21_07210 [Conchiformibius steedae]URD67099.1 hypothetical protein LNQ82_07860 [Conchiformibius steedae DSM 2580]
MTDEKIFQNTALQDIRFAHQGRDLILFFDNTENGRYYGEIHCEGLLEFTFQSLGFIHYPDDGDSLFPLFVRDVLVQPTHQGYTLRIEAGLVIQISCLNMRVEQDLAFDGV